ncbi:hypothetical protein ACVMB3_005091 [Sinorhizobium meliloti]
MGTVAAVRQCAVPQALGDSWNLERGTMRPGAVDPPSASRRNAKAPAAALFRPHRVENSAVRPCSAGSMLKAPMLVIYFSPRVTFHATLFSYL